MEDIEHLKPNNFLPWSILVTILCCLPIGIVAIVYANKVDSLWLTAKYNEANEAAKKAKLWTLISAGIGVVGYILLFFMGCVAIFVSS
jgi:hypothetical protein